MKNKFPQLSSTPPQMPQAPKFEYSSIVDPPSAFTSKLNAAGRDGWQLIQFSTVANGTGLVFAGVLKRQLFDE